MEVYNTYDKVSAHGLFYRNHERSTGVIQLVHRKVIVIYNAAIRIFIDRWWLRSSFIGAMKLYRLFHIP